MKSFKLLIPLTFLAVLIAWKAPNGDEKLDKVLEKHFETMGYEKMEDLESIVMKGKVNRMGMEMPFKLIKKRPGKVRQEFEFQENDYVSAYDGKNGWAIQPGMEASKKAQDLTGDRLEQLKDRASFEGQLYNYEEKGYEVEFLGEEKMEGTPVYKVELKKDAEETVHYFIGKGNYILLKRKVTRKNEAGKEQTFELIYSNYKRVEGIPFSHVQEIGTGEDEQGQKIVIESIELDKAVDDELFERPGSKDKASRQ